jgi:hypothetical protein
VRRSYWANDPSDEERMWAECLVALNAIDEPRLIHYGSYERSFLTQMKKRYPHLGQGTPIDHLIESTVNLLAVIYAHVYFPTYSNGLKNIARHLGLRWSDPASSGLAALCWRRQWELSREPDLKQSLLISNQEDCAAAQTVAEALSALSRSLPVGGADVVGDPAAVVRGDHGFRSRAGGLSQHRQRDEADGNQSAVGRRHRLHPAENGVCLSGADSGRLFAEGRGLGIGANPGHPVALAALEQAIAERQPPPGMVHHSDRGLQYASGDYVRTLRKHQLVLSMRRPANPYDNASCESFMKTLKREEIYANEYRDLDHLRMNIVEFIDRYYNRCRLHSALGYRPPEEVRADGGGRGNLAGREHGFFQASGDLSIRWEVLKNGKPAESGSSAHRLDESPAWLFLGGLVSTRARLRFASQR